MGKTEKRNASQKMAADLVARGFYHGKRQSRPFANSGGTTMTQGPGSSKQQRRFKI